MQAVAAQVTTPINAAVRWCASCRGYVVSASFLTAVAPRPQVARPKFYALNPVLLTRGSAAIRAKTFDVVA